MERRYLTRTDAEQTRFERNCYIAGATIFALGVTSLVTGAVRYDHWGNPSAEQVAIRRNITEFQQSNTNNETYRQLALRLQETETEDSLDEMLIIGGILGFVSGPFVLALPGAEVKVGMGL